ncbi:hypothetical protein MASR2M36_05100 [Providencia sp.]
MKIPKAISLTSQNHTKNQTNGSISLNDMVDNIIRKSSFYEGNSYLIIDKIVSLKNNAGANGMQEIQEAWAKMNDDSVGQNAKYKIKKYFNKAMGASNNYFSPPSGELLSDKKIKIEKIEKIEQKLHSDDLSNNSIKKNTPTENDAKYDEDIEDMEHCGRVNVEQKKEGVCEKINNFISELLPNKNKYNQSNSSEQEPEFQKILASHTIEEAIKIKLVFNKISHRSLNLIESKIKAKFDELKSSDTPYIFEREMLNAQGILKQYDNELVCKKIDAIINKYLDEYELYIRENKSPMSRIHCAIDSVFRLQDISLRKLDEFKMAIIDYMESEPIENIEICSSKLRHEISGRTHANIAGKVNDFIEIHVIERMNKLKGNEEVNVTSKKELLETKKNIDTEALLKEVSLKKIVLHVFNRVINNIRRLFSRN